MVERWSSSLLRLRWYVCLVCLPHSLCTYLAGPYPEIKFSTIISRVNRSTIQPSHLFFRTSAASRSAPRFLRESAMLPPGMYNACVQTLHKIARSIPPSQVLEVHFADEEGDPFAVELAARLGGYVVGKDSDFVVLNADGYQGYIPLDLMVWTTLSGEDEDMGEAEDDGFQTVVKSKSKKKAAFSRGGASRGIIPPDDAEGLQLSVITYSPTSLAQHLQLPLSLLPLLGALVGNDFTGERDPSYATTSQQTNLQWLFFEKSLTLSQRIIRVAATLRTILNAALAPASGGKKQKHAVHSVMELIERAVNALIVRNMDTLASGERERVVERVVEATLQYAIPRYEGALAGADSLWADATCALHDAESCPLLRCFDPGAEDAQREDEGEARRQTRERVAALYVAAYRAGQLDPHVLDVLHSGTFWYRLFLENPDLESVSRSIGRPLQMWVYALMDDAIGLRARQEVEDPEPELDLEPAEDVESDQDELIDVVEESEDEEGDPLAPLRGALQQLGGSEEGTLDGQASEDLAAKDRSKRKSAVKIVEEYVRRGTRLAAEEVLVPSLSALVSIASSTATDSDASEDTAVQLRPLQERMIFLLRALQSDYPLIRSLPSEQRTAALVLRWVVHQLHSRAQDHPGDKSREKERWTKQEARAFLAAFSFSTPSTDEAEPSEPVPILDRNVQLVAQASVTLDSVIRLSQLLLLADELSSPLLRFSGRRFHAYLTGSQAIPADGVPDRLWHACVEGLDHAFGEPPGKKKKKDKREAANSAKTQPADKKARTVGGFGGKFGLLADVEA